MKIAFITNICTHYVIRLFELLAQKHDVDFYFTGGQEGYWEKQNKTWLGRFKGVYLRGFFLIPRFKITPALFKFPFKKYDIFIKTIDDRFALPFIFLLSKILRKPFILWTGQWAHPQTWFHRLSFGMTKFIYRHSDAVIVYGEHVRRYLTRFGISDRKIFTAPHSVDNAVFDKAVSAQEKSQWKVKLRLSEEKVVLYVGRLEECKGLSYLIEAIRLIKNDHVRLVCIGAGSQKAFLEGLCQKSCCRCLFLEHIPNQELYRYYSISDVFVLPSIATKSFKEPWGLVINEAMNQGCPVVTTEAVGAAAGGLVEHGRNGFIVPERDALALSRAIRTLLADDNLRQQFSQKAKEKIQGWTPLETARGFMEAVEFVSSSSSKMSCA